ncbi:ABC transporter permease [Romboutsia weinsteinii]|uniref:ABC transporter permease n=1 Tax=Romboutsia weinsteinii TaxID=2020949 RepID=A0A371IYR9_9FIRM|nr:ABC transporter permease [Romboutsia weinsteinii]RDY25619.1 ABC transporter permease [Romboutsia weinsteinii]
MKLNDICKKLLKSNLNNYKVLIFCIILGTMLFTSYGLLIFSSTVTDVISDSGSTQMIAYTIYGAFSIACLMFILYSHSLFMKYKSKEIGVFMSLGINRNNVVGILLKELKYILPIASVVGMILALPFTYIVWIFITSIAGSSQIVYKIGWFGFVGGAIFSVMTIMFLSKKTSRYVQKIDIMKILKISEDIEHVKAGNYKLGFLGLIMIPIGIFCATSNMRGILLDSVPSAKFVFFLMIIIGLYLVCASFTTMGDLAKSVSNKNYYKNIIFYNLLKLKGKQYTATLFTVTTLIAITIFAMCFSFVNVLGKNEIAEILAPFDFSILKSQNQNNLIEKDTIYEIANKNDTKINDYNEIELLTLVKNFSQEEIDRYGVYVDPELCVKESDYNKLYNENIDVKPGMYYIVSSDKGTFKVKRYKNMELSGLGNDNKYMLEKQGDIFKQLILGQQGTNGFILDDKDFEKLKSQSPSDAIETNVLFNVDNWKNSYDFYKELESWSILNNEEGLLMYGGAFDRVYNDMSLEFVNANELSPTDYRDWPYKINSKIYMTTDALKIEMVYPLLFGYIALLSLIASAMILYIKVLNTSWQDSTVYKNISLLGANNKAIKSIISKQLLIIFMIPTVVGISLGVMIQTAMTGQNLTADIYRNYALLFSLLFALVQILVFALARKVILKKSIKCELT